MTSYLVLEAPNGPDRDHKTTRFVADRFSWLALVFPWIWLASNRLWLAAVAAFSMQLMASQLSTLPGLGIVGLLSGLAIALFCALEGRNFLVQHMISKGWELKTIVSAPDLSTAEDIYFSERPQTDPTETTIPQPVWKASPEASRAYGVNDAAGLFQFDFNGRR
jgi:hypothetical protein